MPMISSGIERFPGLPGLDTITAIQAAAPQQQSRQAQLDSDMGEQIMGVIKVNAVGEHL